MWDFRKASVAALRRPRLAVQLHQATGTALDKRAHVVAEVPEWESLRHRARQIKLHTLTHLDRYVSQFVAAAESAGARVHWADTGDDACRMAVAAAKAAGAGLVAKAKSMASEEIHLNAALEAAGIRPAETDFGEMICQLAGQMPSHVTAPIIQWSLEEVARLLVERGVITHLPTLPPADAPRAARIQAASTLIAAARLKMRERFLAADVGVSGANFAVAESGSLVLLENEANIRLSTSLPRAHIAVVGIEKLIPRLEDLGTFLTLLPASTTGQRQACYTSLIHGPLRQLDIILLDNGRSRLLADPEHFDLLSCVRCGACMNVCPVYREVSGHAYGGVYPGPIGSALQPHLRGIDPFGELPFASSLCGACSEVCPVAIPLHERLLQWRERLVRDGMRPRSEALAFAGWAWLMSRPGLYRGMRPPAAWINAMASLFGPVRAWKQTRGPLPLAKQSFAQWWKHERAR